MAATDADLEQGLCNTAAGHARSPDDERIGLLSQGGGNARSPGHARSPANERIGLLSQGGGNSTHGLAYLKSFDDDEPVLVFRRNPVSAGEVVSHKVGHTLGLRHDGQNDGQNSSEYYTGHGAYPHRWAPIMGGSSNRGVSHWSKGEYAGANNLQDDIAQIQRFLAPTFDHGQEPASATLLSSGTQGSVDVEAAGIISTRWETDYFKVDHGGGSISVSLLGSDVRPNLNAQLSIRDVFNNVLIHSVGSSPTRGSSIPPTTLDAGAYFISVDGVGSGDPAVDGYSDYGSLGRYWIVVHFNEIKFQCNADGVCQPGEDAATCPYDCVYNVCNANGVCKAGEDAASCPADCVFNKGTFVVGDRVCSAGLGEDCSTSPLDCKRKKRRKWRKGFCCGSTADCLSGKCGPSCYDARPVCGDGICQKGIEDTEDHWCKMDCDVIGPKCLASGSQSSSAFECCSNKRNRKKRCA
eukprot:gene25967-11652_t